MSTSIDQMQRMKGQGGPVSNGPKDPVNDDEFDTWRNRHHQVSVHEQSYNAPMSASSMGDQFMFPYGMSYPAYQNLGLGEGAWSNGSETMAFLSGYGGQMPSEQHSHYVDGMLGGGAGAFGGFGQPGFNYFHGSGDYSAWGTPGIGRKPATHAAAAAAHYDDYYSRDMYNVAADAAAAASASNTVASAAAMKPVEQNMQGLSLSDKTDSKVDGNCKGGVPPDPSKAGVVAVGGVPSGPEGLQLSGGGGVAAGGGGGGPQAPKKMTWASIASQPAKPQPKMKPKGIPPTPMLPGKHNLDIGTWESKNGSVHKAVIVQQQQQPQQQQPPGAARATWAPRGRGGGGGGNNPGPAGATPGLYPASVIALAGPTSAIGPHAVGGGQAGSVAGNCGPPSAALPLPSHPVLDKLRQSNEYNPKEFDMSPKNARFFIIKSYSEDDIHRSIKYGIWCSTEHGNKRLDTAYRDQETRGPIYLFYSVNGSGHFCGMAQMVSEVDHNVTSNVWAQDKWKGVFKVKWIYVKDVPNAQLRHIRLENNENKPVTNSRDTQEVPQDKGKQVLKIIHSYRHTTSIFDDFIHYEKRQEEEDQRRQV